MKQKNNYKIGFILSLLVGLTIVLSISSCAALSSSDQDIKKYISMLESEDDYSRYEAYNKLIELKDKSIIPDLVELLESQRKDTRMCAISILGEIGDSCTAPFLIGLLKDNDADIRKTAMSSLKSIWYSGSEYVKEYVRDFLKSSEYKPKTDPTIQALFDLNIDKKKALRKIINYAFKARDDRDKKALLAHLKDESLTPYLKELLNDENPAIRNIVLKMLVELDDYSIIPILIESIDRNKYNFYTSIEETTKTPFLKFSERSGSESDIYLAYYLMKLKSEAGTFILFDLLENKRNFYRIPYNLGMEKALAEFNTATLTTTFINIAQKDNRYKSIAYNLVTKMGDTTIVPLLMKELNQNKSISLAAFKGLKNLGIKYSMSGWQKISKNKTIENYYSTSLFCDENQKPIIPLIKMALESDNVTFQKAALFALPNSVSGFLIPSLSKLLSSEDAKITGRVAYILLKFRDQNIITKIMKLTEKKHPSVYKRAKSVLEDMKSNIGPRVLKLALDNKDKEVRSTALAIIAERGELSMLPDVVNTLEDKSIKVRMQAIENLYELGNESILTHIAEMLKDENEDVRRKARDTLIRIYDRSVIPYVSKMTMNKSDKVRLEAISLLRTIGDESCKETFINALKDQNNLARYEAALALIELGEDIPSDVFCDLLKDKNPKIRQKAIFILGWLKEQSASSLILEMAKDINPDVRKEALSGLFQLSNEQLMPVLKEATKDENLSVRSTAIFILRELNDKTTTPIITEALQNSDIGIRWCAISLLARLRDSKASPSLLEVLSDSNLGIKRKAIYALGEIRDTSTIDSLAKIANSEEDMIIRIEAISALSKFTDEAIVPIMIKMLDGEKTALATIYFLGKQNNKNVVPILLAAAKSPNINLQFEAIGLMSKRGMSDEKFIPVLVNFTKSNNLAVRKQAIGTLGSSIWQFQNNKEIAKEIATVLIEAGKNKDENLAIRRRAISSLNVGTIRFEDGSHQVKDLISLLKDDDAEIRRAAVRALSGGYKSAIPALTEALEDNDPYVRCDAMWSLGYTKDPSILPTLIKAIQGDDANVRVGAIHFLGIMGNQDVLGYLEEAFKKEQDERYRRAINQAISRIKARNK